MGSQPNSTHVPGNELDWAIAAEMLRDIAHRMLLDEDTQMQTNELVQKAIAEHVLHAQAASPQPLGRKQMTELVRRTLIDHARYKTALKRNEGHVPVSFDEQSPGVPSHTRWYDALELKMAIDAYDAVDPEGCEAMMLSAFGRLSTPQIGHCLGIPQHRVRAHLSAGRLWLLRRLRDDPEKNK